MYPQKRFARCCCLSFLLTSFTPVFSQELPATPSQSAANWSDSTISYLGADSRLYNGAEYIRNGTPAKGFPFCDVDSLRSGTLYYDDFLIHHVPMEYDLVLDKLIIPVATSNALISLISEKLTYFSIGDQHFRYIDANKTASVLHRSGFYEELYHNGSTLLLARREKTLVFPSNRDDLPHYDQHNAYFLLLEGRYYSINEENDLLDALKSKKEALKQYIRKNKIRYKKTPEPALIRTIDYYLQISH